MINSSLARALVASFMIAGLGVTLAGCDTDEVSLASNAKANQPVPPKLLAAMAEKDMDLQSPILIRLFKQEAELEVWKQDRSGKFALLKTYPICRWSGDLGPKVREGDRQAPEGFYEITPAQMNPRSAYYLSFNTGFPNAYDRALGRSGSELMVHGDCSSRGCYAMTDEQIAEIYALGRESFFGGQRAFQFAAFPFRMTPANMAKHRNNPNMAFWKMIKEGYDHFEVSRQQPKVDFCEKHYVFDAAKAPDATRDPVFQASAKCPPYVIPDELAALVREKQAQDEAEYEKLVVKGTPVAKLNTGIDGGMNKIFASHVPGASTGLSEGGEDQGLSFVASQRLPGTIPGTVNPPHPPEPTEQQPPVVAAAAPTPAAPATTRVASATGETPSEGFFARLAHKMGMGGAAADTTATAATRAPAAKPKPSETRTADSKTVQSKSSDAKSADAKSADSKKTRPAETKQADGSQAASGGDAAAVPAKGAIVAGAQPIVSGSFESRFSATK